MALAARGARNMDSGEERIEDQALVAQLRRQARRVHIRSVLIALVLTIAFLLLPL